jgi:hypothetical protein
VRGLILGCYVHNGEERSALGFPISEEYTPAGTANRRSDFENGSILYCPGGCSGRNTADVVVIGPAMSCP